MTNIYKYRLKLAKTGELRFISHLDWQNLILKIFRRLELNLVLSEGFNKMPKISYSPALPIFLESECELVNFQTYEPLSPDFKENFEKYSPNGIKLLSIEKIKPDVKLLNKLKPAPKDAGFFKKMGHWIKDVSLKSY